MLRSVADACAKGPQSPRGAVLVCVGLAALAGVVLLSSRAPEVAEEGAGPSSAALRAGQALVAQKVITPEDIRLRTCPEVKQYCNNT